MFTLLPWLILSFAAPECPPLDRLQTGATTGQLSDQAVQCLLDSRQSESNTERRAQISGLLIANSYAQGQTTDWSAHVRWHLEHVDGDDADLSYQFGLYLYKRGASDEAEKWGRHALANAYRWQGQDEADVKRLNTYALIARAVQQGHDAMVKTEEPATMVVRASVSRIQLASVQWLAAATEADRDGSEALAMCTKTGWDAARCESRAAAMR